MAWLVQVTYLYYHMIKLLDLLLEAVNKPKAIFLAGPAGSGKTFTSAQLIPKNLTVKDMQGKYWSESASEIPENIAIKLKNFRESTPLEEAPSATSIGLNNPARVRSQFAAFDPRFKDSPLLMAGGLAGANILPTTEQQLNPFARLSDVAGAWETAKEKVSKPLAKSLNLSGNPQDEAAFNQILKTGLDPLNFLPGAAGLAAGAAQMFTPSDEERAKKEAEDEMRKRVLNQMAGQ